MSVLKHIVAELQCISDNKSSLGSMLLLEYNSNPTNIQITNINTWQDRSSHMIIHTQSKGENSLRFIKEYKIKYFSTSYLLWEK